jgi:hypothetical protein
MKNNLLKLTFFFTVLMVAGREYKAIAQKAVTIEIGYSLGIFRSKILDEWDNSIVYGHSACQPFKIYLKFADEKWTHLLNFYYVKNKLNPLGGSELYNYNYMTNESGELTYDILYKVYHPEESCFSLYAGTGIHAFGSLRDRQTKSKMYPYEDRINAYDINAGSLQAILNPILKKNKRYFSLSVSAGMLNLLTRPDSYNPRYNFNNNKWLLVSVHRHFNLLGTLAYGYKISGRLTVNAEYRYFYYSYSFPYHLKVLNQNYLIGLSYKF